MTRKEILDAIRGRLIVSCQALEDEPLHGSGIMARMAYAAMLGGAGGIRANSTEDIRAIRELVNLPLIGIIKREYPGSEVYITPTMEEVDRLAEVGAEIIAADATDRERPAGESLAVFFRRVREKYPHQLFMADCSTVEEGVAAAAMGFDLVGTTLSGYTPYTRGRKLPDYAMMERLVREAGVPVIAEGGVWTPEQLRRAMDCGVHAAVVGTAITRVKNITERFVAAL